LLNDVILLSVNKDPAQRFQSAEAFRAALGNVTAAAAPAAPDDAVTVPMAVTKPRRGMWLAVGALCAVAGIVAARLSRRKLSDWVTKPASAIVSMTNPP